MVNFVYKYGNDLTDQKMERTFILPDGLTVRKEASSIPSAADQSELSYRKKLIDNLTDHWKNEASIVGSKDGAKSAAALIKSQVD